MSRSLSDRIDNAIKPEAWKTIHWTMVSIGTFASVGPMIAFLEKTTARFLNGRSDFF
jgi:hypothetical protein